MEEGTALVILSAIGTDMSRWPSVKHFCSWLGLSPPHQLSGGKVLSRRVRPGVQRVTVALRLAARTVHQAPTALGAFYRRMRSRLGAPKAITVTAPKLARLVYSLLKHGSAYVQQYMTDTNYDKVEHLTDWAHARGHTMGELAHAWLLAQPQVSSVISGATSIEQVHQNAKAADWRLTADELAEVNAVLGA